jgi:hypothetical protein
MLQGVQHILSKILKKSNAIPSAYIFQFMDGIKFKCGRNVKFQVYIPTLSSEAKETSSKPRVMQNKMR